MIETDAMGAPIAVGDLDAEWLLALAHEAATECWKAERRRLRLAAHWCVLHPATPESGFVTWSDTGLPGLCPGEEAALGGEGTPLVAAFTPPAEGGYRRLVGNAPEDRSGGGRLATCRRPRPRTRNRRQGRNHSGLA